VVGPTHRAIEGGSRCSLQCSLQAILVCRRKRSQVKGLYAALTNRVTQDTSSDEESHDFVYSDHVDTPYVVSVKKKHMYELKGLIRNAIMNP
jgi:hypothetical protein